MPPNKIVLEGAEVPIGTVMVRTIKTTSTLAETVPGVPGIPVIAHPVLEAVVVLENSDPAPPTTMFVTIVEAKAIMQMIVLPSLEAIVKVKEITAKVETAMVGNSKDPIMCRNKALACSQQQLQ